jgi:hypothetical protein
VVWGQGWFFYLKNREIIARKLRKQGTTQKAVVQNKSYP